MNFCCWPKLAGCLDVGLVWWDDLVGLVFALPKFVGDTNFGFGFSLVRERQEWQQSWISGGRERERGSRDQ
jgi:hypothetical protein